MMLRISARPRPATPGNALTEGHTTRILASALCGGTNPVTACRRASLADTMPCSLGNPCDGFRPYSYRASDNRQALRLPSSLPVAWPFPQSDGGAGRETVHL